MARGWTRAAVCPMAVVALALGSFAICSAQTPALSADAARLDMHRATIAAVRRQVDGEESRPQTADAAWNTLREIPLQSKIQVESATGAEIKGRLASVEDSAITVNTDTEAWRVLRSDVRRVRVLNPGKRLLIGMIGTIAGVMTPVIGCPSCENEGHSTTKGRIILGGVGSLLFLAPQTSTIYKAPGKR